MSDQPPIGKDLPDGPGTVWVRDGEWWMLNDKSARRLLLDHCLSVGYMKSIESLPRGNWFPAVPQDACTVNWTDTEREAIAHLGKIKELSSEQVIRQAVRLYQLTVYRERDGETCTWSGDAQRASEFAGTPKADPQMEAASLEAHAKGDYLTSEQYLEEIRGLLRQRAQERHQAEVYRKQMVEVERQRDELAEMLKVKNRAANIAELTKRAETAEAELAAAIFTFDIHGFRRCESAACNCGRWHPGNNSASERLMELSDELNEAGFQPMQKTALVALREALAQLTAANKRLANVRDALSRLAKWTNLSLFSKTILAEAQAVLAEGEG